MVVHLKVQTILAIVGELFWGIGELAGHMKQKGQLWLLWPKGAKLPEAS